METIAIYKAALKLIKEGKVGFLSMAEVGYHARVSATAVESLFENSEHLIGALGEHIFDKITILIASITQAPGTFEQRYHKLYNALISFYRNNQDVIPFLDHFRNFPINIDGVKEREHQMLTLLITFFSEYPLMGRVLTSGTIANLFHENIKIIARSENLIPQNEIDMVARLFLKAMEQPRPVTEPLDAA